MYVSSSICADTSLSLSLSLSPSAPAPPPAPPAALEGGATGAGAAAAGTAERGGTRNAAAGAERGASLSVVVWGARAEGGGAQRDNTISLSNAGSGVRHAPLPRAGGGGVEGHGLTRASLQLPGCARVRVCGAPAVCLQVSGGFIPPLRKIPAGGTRDGVSAPVYPLHRQQVFSAPTRTVSAHARVAATIGLP